jgi:hypothetical protein
VIRVARWYIFKTKITIWVNFDLLYFKAIRYILWSFGILFDDLAHFSRYGMLYQEKSGNPDRDSAFFYTPDLYT